MKEVDLDFAIQKLFPTLVRLRYGEIRLKVQDGVVVHVEVTRESYKPTELIDVAKKSKKLIVKGGRKGDGKGP